MAAESGLFLATVLQCVLPAGGQKSHPVGKTLLLTFGNQK